MLQTESIANEYKEIEQYSQNNYRNIRIRKK